MTKAIDTAAASPKAASGAAGASITAKKGESVDQIAARAGLEPAAVLRANPHLKPGQALRQGQEVALPHAPMTTQQPREPLHHAARHVDRYETPNPRRNVFSEQQRPQGPMPGKDTTPPIHLPVPHLAARQSGSAVNPSRDADSGDIGGRALNDDPLKVVKDMGDAAVETAQNAAKEMTEQLAESAHKTREALPMIATVAKEIAHVVTGVSPLPRTVAEKTVDVGVKVMDKTLEAIEDSAGRGARTTEGARQPEGAAIRTAS